MSRKHTPRIGLSAFQRRLLPGLLWAALMVASAAPAVAQQHETAVFRPFVVRDIRVEGLQRTEPGTVFTYLPIKVGETVDNEKVSESIRTLYATGFFKDVRIEAEGNVLIVSVVERPAIASITFEGMKEFEKDVVLKALREVGLADSRIFDRSVLERAEQELKRQYLSRGKYAVQITTTVTPLERNRVGINFNIVEGDTAKIREINIIGAKAYPESELEDLFELSTPTWMSWYTKSDQYSRQKLTADLEKLRSFYQDRGYLDYAIDSTQVSMSPNKENIYLTITQSEGNRYVISSVKVLGEFIVPESEIRKLIMIAPGQVFSRDKVNQTVKAINERLGKEGYAFANVNAAPDINREKRLVGFTLFVDPGRRVYVRKVNVTGNTKSRDEVVRQDMRQIEGAWYDADKIKLSRERLMRTDYYKQVDIQTPPAAGTNDQVDVNVNVEEKSTGSFQIGAGFSSYEKLTLSGSISQNNLFGSGKNVTLAVNTSKVNTLYNLSYTDPYWTVNNVSIGYDLYYRTFNSATLDWLSTYKTLSGGGGIRFAYPLSETSSMNLGFTMDSTNINLSGASTVTVTDTSVTPNATYSYPNVPYNIYNFTQQYGSTNTSLISSVGWRLNSLNSNIMPTEGNRFGVGAEVASPPGSIAYYKLSYQQQHYLPLNQKKTLLLMGNANLGYGQGMGDKAYPFYKNFYAGGIGSVRGYKPGTVGPQATNAGGGTSYIGGNQLATGNFEVQGALPGLAETMRWNIFYDVGYVGAVGSATPGCYPGLACNPTNNSIATSVGLGMTWVSPVGPLKFSLGYPLGAGPGAQRQPFQFTMGSAF
ncbi:MAG: outer membrane protein assembly factor BamA [Pseudomonadota bacterium]|jgi:outer membrane protein insertion porin family